MEMLEYLQLKAAVIAISVAGAAVNFGFAAACVIILVNEYAAPKIPAIFKGALYMAAVYVIPRTIIEDPLYFAETVDQNLKGFFLFPSPLYMFAYFWILTRIVGLPRRFTTAILSEILYSQYIVLLLFRGYSGLFMSLIVPAADWPFSVEADIIGLLATTLTSSLFTLASLAYLRGKPGRRNVTDQPLESYGSLKNALLCLGALPMYLLVSLLGIHNLSVHWDSWDIRDILICVTLILVLVATIRDGARKRKLDILEWNDSVAKDYIQSLTLISDDLLGARHGWNNILQVYSGYISLADFDGLREYHHSLVTAVERTNQSFSLISSLSHRHAIYTILHLKIQKARQERIRLEIDRLDCLSNVVVNDMDMCRLLGNLLDNAIEAALETEERFIEIRCKSMPPGCVKLEISNSARGNVDLRKIYKQGWTTKDGHDGMGMCVVQRILSAYDLCYILLEHGDNLFRVHMTLKTN